MKKIKALKRRTSRIIYGGIWKVFKNDLMLNPYIGIAVAFGLLLVGSYLAAVINYISTSEDSLFRFIFSFSTCILILIVGFFFFYPYWNFRRKYFFLENEENNIAKKLVNIYNKSNRAVTSFDGVHAIQFFKIETHTDDRHVQYRFIKIFSLKSRYFNLSRLKGKEIEVPIKLFEWLQNPEIPAPNYGQTINGLIYEWLIRRSKDESKFNEIIDNWNISFRKEPRIVSLHYHILFEPKETIDTNLFNFSSEIEPIFEMEYNGINDYHGDRNYYSVRININDESEGTLDGVLLIIGNKQRLDNVKVKKIVGGILN